MGTLSLPPSQVEANLLESTAIGARPTSRSGHTPNKPPSGPVPPLVISCYSSPLQLQYTTVLSRPSAAASSSLLKEGACPDEDGTSPRFYNVRVIKPEEAAPGVLVDAEREPLPEAKVDERVRKSEVEMLVIKALPVLSLPPHSLSLFPSSSLSLCLPHPSSPPQACRLLLTLPPPSDHAQEPPKKGYDLLVGALLSMMDVGTSYHLQSRALPERVLLATSAHQCFSLAMGMLGALPPGYHVLTAMVEGEGLSVIVSGWGKGCGNCVL